MDNLNSQRVMKLRTDHLEGTYYGVASHTTYLWLVQEGIKKKGEAA